MTVREDILRAIASLEKRTGDNAFRVGDVVRELHRMGIAHKRSTIQTHIVSAMCVNAPQHHTINYADLIRIDRGLYRRVVASDNVEGLRAEGAVPLAKSRPNRVERMADRTHRLIDDFSGSLRTFNSARPFTGPSIYFHERTTELVSRHASPSEAIADLAVVEAIYATLTSWGMHRMGPKGAKLPSFAAFRQGLARAASRLDELRSLRMADLAPTDAVNVASRLWSIIEELEVSTTSSHLVSGTKTLHHILPELVPPIDRQYTAQFFYGSPGKAWYMGEGRALEEILPEMAAIAAACDSEIADELSRPDAFLATSLTKVIDNAIVGYVLKQQLPS